MSYGNLALMHNGKLPLKGRQASSYLIIHVPTKTRVVGPLRGHKYAIEIVERLLGVDDWEFNEVDSLDPQRAMKMLGELRRVEEEEASRCRT